MKKTKVYRPRRGLRFTNGRRGASPAAGFVSGGSIKRSRPSGPATNLTSPSLAVSGTDAFLDLNFLGIDVVLVTNATGSAGNKLQFLIGADQPSGSFYSENANGGAFHYTDGVTTIGALTASFPSTLFSVATGTAHPGNIIPTTNSVLRFGNGRDPVPQGPPFLLLTDDGANRSSVVDGAVYRAIGRPRAFYCPFSPVVSSSSFDLQGAISTGRLYERRKLDAKLLGRSRASVGTVPFPSVTVIDVNPTGTFTIPSWTHASIGTNQAFVIGSLSSSNYDSIVLNTFVSGTESLESSAVPATAQLHFTKSQRFQKLIVKKTASFFDTVIPTSGVIVPTTFLPGTGTLINTVTGTNIAQTISFYRFPATVQIPVSQSGYLTDLKVWVELVHMSGVVSSSYPLGNLSIAIRHPTLRWGHAYPIRNDPALVRVYNSDTAVFTGDQNFFRDRYSPPGNFFHSTFILWEGPPTLTGRGPYDLEAQTNGGFDDVRYPVWQRDRSMRTIFTDGATVPNPRHHYVRGFVSGNNVGAPNSAILATGSAFGFDVPWTSDKTVFPGTESYQAPGSPPPGWLTGPGGIAAVNEWPTTGSNYGTNQIRPFLPLLDPIFARKRITDELPTVGLNLTSSDAIFTPNAWSGFRPGLRGTQISGTWEILFTQNNLSLVPVSAAFRQVRLEFTYETSPSFLRPRISRRFSPRLSGPRYLFSISGSDDSNNVFGISFPGKGSASWDWYVTDIFTADDNHGEIGRSFGISLNPAGTAQVNSPALTYRLSGALADIVGSTPSWLLDRFTGMPAIPESSATMVPRVSEPVSLVPFTQFLLPRSSLDSPQLLKTVAQATNPPQTLRDLASAFTASAAT